MALMPSKKVRLTTEGLLLGSSSTLWMFSRGSKHFREGPADEKKLASIATSWRSRTPDRMTTTRMNFQEEVSLS